MTVSTEARHSSVAFARPADAETCTFTIAFTRPSYTVAEWAEACGIGETTVREAEKAGELFFSYPNSKAIVTLEEGMRWLRSLPNEKPGS